MFVFLLNCIYTNAADTTSVKSDSVKYVTNTNTEKLIDKYSDKVSAAITSLAKELKQPAEYVYKTIVKQQYVVAITDIFLNVIFIVSSIICFYFSLKYRKKSGEVLGEYDDFVQIFLVAGIILSIMSILFIIINFSEIMTGLFNPDYGAITTIGSFFK